MNIVITILSSLFTWFLNRSKEPSSQAGVAILAQVIQYFLPDATPAFVGTIMDTITGLCAILSFVLKEKAKPAAPTTPTDSTPAS